MEVLGKIGSMLFGAGETGTKPPTNKAQDNKQIQDDSEICSKDAAKAAKAQAQAAVSLSSGPRVRNIDTSKLTGTMFPDFDDMDITKDYLELKKEARSTALSVTRKLYRTFTTGNMKDLKDKEGNVTASFEIPEPPKDDNFKDADFSSYRMIEYDKKTGKRKAVTRMYNHNDFATHWNKRHSPYMERIEYGETPNDTTYLRVNFDYEEKNGKYILIPRVQTYAKGYKTDGKILGIRQADKLISRAIHDNYESYRTNYSAPEGVWLGDFLTVPANVTEAGGIEGEEFDSALEYPQKQLKIGDETYIINPYYVNEKGNRD